jgi:glycosyltransferase involved in cell wall biosynthesis
MALRVIGGLRQRGHDVYCVTNAWNDGQFASRLNRMGVPNGGEYFGKFSKSLRPRSLWWSINAAAHLPGARRSLKRKLRSLRPDVALVFNRDLLLLAGDLIAQVPTIFHVHELAEQTSAGRWVYALIDRFVDEYVAASEHLGKRLLALGVAQDRIAVIHNGIAPLEPSVGTPTGASVTVGIVGQVGEWKGHEDLFEAIGILKAEGCSLRCAIFGTGSPEYLQRLRSMADALGISSALHWHGFVQRAEDIYSAIDICVVPSRFEEPFGLVAAEAGACGLPVIATRRGGLAEIVQDSETGFLVSENAPRELASRLRRLVDDSQLRTRLGAKARERVLANFSEQVMIDRIEALCQRIVSNKARSTPSPTSRGQ